MRDGKPWTTPGGGHLRSEGDDHQRVRRLGRRCASRTISSSGRSARSSARARGAAWSARLGVPQTIDGGGITAPGLAFYDLNGKWAIENEGIAPDIEVEYTAADVHQGTRSAARARGRGGAQAARGASDQAGAPAGSHQPHTAMRKSTTSASRRSSRDGPGSSSPSFSRARLRRCSRKRNGRPTWPPSTSTSREPRRLARARRSPSPIVKDDSLVFAKGYGVLEIGKPAPRRRAHALRDRLDDQGDDRRRARDARRRGEAELGRPGHRLHPRACSSTTRTPSHELTMRDLLTHRTRLAGTDLFWATGGRHTRSPEIIRRLRYVKPEYVVPIARGNIRTSCTRSAG